MKRPSYQIVFSQREKGWEIWVEDELRIGPFSNLAVAQDVLDQMETLDALAQEEGEAAL